MYVKCKYINSRHIFKLSKGGEVSGTFARIMPKAGQGKLSKSGLKI